MPTIKAIPFQMAQLFGNLMGNSLKYSRKNVPPLITVSAHELGGTEKKAYKTNHSIRCLKIEFWDNGIGFKEDLINAMNPTWKDLWEIIGQW